MPLSREHPVCDTSDQGAHFTTAELGARVVDRGHIAQTESRRQKPRACPHLVSVEQIERRLPDLCQTKQLLGLATIESTGLAPARECSFRNTQIDRQLLLIESGGSQEPLDGGPGEAGVCSADERRYVHTLQPE